MVEILLFGLGAVASGAISYYFFRRSHNEIPDWFSIDNIKDILTRNPDDIEWTAKQIVELYHKKIINEDTNDPLPYNWCPKCGSEDLKRSEVTDYARDRIYYTILCKDCEWTDWVDA